MNWRKEKISVGLIIRELNFIFENPSILSVSQKISHNSTMERKTLIKNPSKKNTIPLDKKRFTVRMANYSMCERENQSVEHSKKMVREQTFRLFDVLPCDPNQRN